MTEHDPVDAWLERDVKPLPPPPGTLERIQVRARRRKRNQVLTAAAGCAVVVAAAVTGPQLASALHGSPGAGYRPGPVAAGSSAPSAQVTGPGRVTPESSAATPEPTHSTLTPGQPARDPVPPAFQPTSVTFAGTGSGGVVGAVIGQAGGGKCATRFCTSLAQTPDYGKTWFGLAAPLAGPPSARTGVSQVRFLSLRDGWAFGPGLWQTTSGGWPWHRQSTGGMRVTDLEGAGHRAFAIFASCTGGGAAYASDCTSFSLYTAQPGDRSWTQVAVPAGYQAMTTATPSSASLVIAGGTTGYLLTPSGEVLTGPVAGGSWSLAGQAPCAPGAPQPNGSPADAQLATGKSLTLACTSGQQSTIYSSADGTTWTRLAVVHTAARATSLGGNSTGQFVLGTGQGLYYSGDGGKHWQPASVPGLPAGGFGYVGMTNATQGVALPADASMGEIFVTSDGGRDWTASAVTSQ